MEKQQKTLVIRIDGWLWRVVAMSWAITEKAKQQPVKVVTSGSITTGYAINSINSSVAKVTVYGDQEVLDNLSSIEAPIDVTGLSTNKTFSGVTLTKPAGVRYMSEYGDMMWESAVDALENVGGMVR